MFVQLLVTWTLATALHHKHPEWAAGLTFTVAVVATLLLAGVVVIAELVQGRVARRLGVPVTSTTLVLFGGVSNGERQPRGPLVEVLTAVASPIVSLVLGFAVLGLTLATGLLPSPTSWSLAVIADQVAALRLAPFLLVWLGLASVAVGFFNLLPGYPLDGGRVLRVALWRALGDLRRATRIAVFVGRALGALLVVAGLAVAFGSRADVLGTGPVRGLWLTLVGWLLCEAAGQSRVQVEDAVVQELLDGVEVGRLMRPVGLTVPPSWPLDVLVQHGFLATGQRAFAVTSYGHLLGLVCMEDVRRVAMEDWPQTLVTEIMRSAQELTVVTAKEPVEEALVRLAVLDVGQLPVVEDVEGEETDRLVGMLRREDIARWVEHQADRAPTSRRSLPPH